MVLAALVGGAGSAVGASAPVLLTRFDGSGIGTSFIYPTGLAIDQSAVGVSGNVLVADGSSNEQIDVFGPQGEQPLGGVSGPLTHSFNFAEEPAGIAIDSSGGPSNGDLYVDDVEHNVIQKFQLVGGNYEYACEIAGFGSGCLAEAGPATQSFVEPVGLTVDSRGNLYVSDYGHEVVDEFSENGADVRQITGSGIALGNPSGLALDSQGDLYVQQYRGGGVLRFAANLLGQVEPETEPTVLDPGPAYGVAVDSHTGEVYVAHASVVAEYSPSGALEGEFGSGVIGEASGIAVNPKTGEIYVADAAHHNVAVFGVPVAQPPLIVSEHVRNVASSSGLLTAEIGARGFDTHCYFEYGPDISYSAGVVPSRPGIDIGSNGGPGSERTAETMLRGLSPGVTYHYRVVAVNSNDEVSYGPDHEFTTLAGATAGLPDGRAWEMVSPPDKNNGDVVRINADSGGGVAQSSTEGNAIAFVSFAAFTGAQSNLEGNQYVASRHAAGWLTQGIDPPAGGQTYEIAYGPPYRAFSSDLSEGLLSGGFANSAHGVENPPLPGSDAPTGYENYYLHGIADGTFEALLNADTSSPPLPPPTAFAMEFVGATPDLKHVVIESSAALSHEVAGELNQRLYEWTGSQFQLITVFPDGTPDDGEDLHIGSELPDPRAISDDGSRVIWTDPVQGLYSREGIGTPHVRTVKLDAARGGPESGAGEFMTASSDGLKVFFTDRRQLTADTDGGGEGLGALYEFELEPGNPEGGRLVDLTPDPGGARVRGVLGEGESKSGGAYVYFVAGGVLASGASADANNLYVLHKDLAANEWTTTFIRTLSPDDNRNESNAPAAGEAFDWTADAAVRTARVTPDGSHLVFMSDSSLTGYDNTDANDTNCGTDAFGNPLPMACEEVFVYDAGSGSLRCASCNPTGERPAGPSGIPGGTDFRPGRGIYQSRVISEDGSRVFFESYDGLVAQDTNGTRDVYEYEGGFAYLLSGGRNDANASFVDASTNGDDVFFITAASLVPQDVDSLVDLYDARAPHLPGEAVGFSALGVSSPCGSEGGCRAAGSPAPPPVSTPSSANFSGPASVVTPSKVATHKPKAAKHKPKKKKRKQKVRKAKARHASGARKLAGKRRAK